MVSRDILTFRQKVMEKTDLVLGSILIEERILTVRGKQVILDRDLAELYNVETKRLNEQVKRNIERFLENFMFRISRDELDGLVAICDRFDKLKHSSSMPYAFTEQGVAMLSAVLHSKVAINVVLVQNIHDRFLIVDSTVYHIGASLKDLGKKLFAFSKMSISTETLLCNIFKT